MPTGISWAEETWNLWTGCSKVSEGCRYCYAERLSLKFGWSHKPWTAQNAKENLVFHRDRLPKPTAWKTSKRIFVNSMSDFFHEMAPDSWLELAFLTMRDCPQHQFLILTKRPDRAMSWTNLPSNVWLGVSVEDANNAWRINRLKDCIAPVKFISFEPLLGPIGKVDLSGIDWAIVGGESGPDFRPMEMAWARELRDQCELFDTAYFFKQDASKQPGTRPFLVEEDGTEIAYHEYPFDAPKLKREKPAPETAQAEQMRLFE